MSSGSKIFRIYINKRTKISRSRIGPACGRNTSQSVTKQTTGRIFLGTGRSCSPWIPGLGSYINHWQDLPRLVSIEREDFPRYKRSSNFCSGTGNCQIIPRPLNCWGQRSSRQIPSQSWGCTASLWLLPSSAGAWNSQGSSLGWLHSMDTEKGCRKEQNNSRYDSKNAHSTQVCARCVKEI